MSACNCCGCEDHTPVFEINGYHLVQCTECHLAFVANPPEAEEMTRLYSASGNDYHAALHDPDSPQSRRIARIAAGHMGFVQSIARGGRLVDVGCSPGAFLAQARRSGFDCSGVEFSRDSASFAARSTGLPIEQGSIHDSRLDAGSCDMLTMFDVIEHVPDPASDLEAAWRLLRPGGWLVLSTPNIDGLFPRLSQGLARTLNYWPHPEPPYHLYQFSVRTLTAMLEKAGFEAVRVQHDRIDLAYSFGAPATLMRMPKRLAYAAAFAPLALIGPLVGQGDCFYLAARKPTQTQRQVA